MSRRFFIAVGSSATEGLTELVKRLKYENVFDRYDDYYVAIDSAILDDAPMKKLQQFAVSCPRISTIELKLDKSTDNAADFQEAWSAIRDIPAGGVGGLRELSCKAIGWREELWHKVIGPVIDSNDHIILIGSAFGGTATGLFWNVAEFVDLELRKRRDADNAFKSVTVLGYVILPESGLRQGYGIGYGPNICDFMREMQRIHWRIRLESMYEDFKVPVYSQGDGARYALHTGLGSTSHGATGDVSFLPMSTLHWLPTPTGRMKQMDSLVAEVLLAGCYVGVAARDALTSGIDRFTGGGQGPAVSHDVEDTCFSGLNMLVLKSGRMQSLRKWFYENLSKSGRAFFAEGSGVIEGNIYSVLEKEVYGSDKEDVLKDDANVKALASAAGAAVHSLEGFNSFVLKLDGLLDNAIAAGRNRPFKSLSFNDLLKTLVDEENWSWVAGLTRQTLANAYTKFNRDLDTQGASVGSRKRDIAEAAANAVREALRRRRQLPVRALGKQDAVDCEVLEMFDAFFAKALKRLLFAARCASTSVMTMDDFNTKLGRYSEICLNVTEVADRSVRSLRTSGNPYVVEGVVVDLVLPQGIRECLPFSVMLLDSAREPNEATRDRIVRDFEAKVISNLQTQMSQKNIATDPLGNATVYPINGATIPDGDGGIGMSLGTYSDFFRLRTCDNHYGHFVIRHGTLPVNFSLTNSDVRQGLKLPTFCGLQPDGDDFLESNHTLGAPANSFTDKPSLLDFGAKKNARGAVAIDGVWLGTVRDNFSAREVLDAVYPVTMLNQWMDDSNLYNNGRAYPRRLETLRNMVFMGVLIQAIERQVGKAWGMQPPGALVYEKLLTLTFKSRAKARSTVPVPLANAGFSVSKQNRLTMTHMSREWVKYFTRWLQDTGPDGFQSFYGTDSYLQSLETIDAMVLNSIRLKIEGQEKNDIDRLGVIIADGLTATIQ